MSEWQPIETAPTDGQTITVAWMPGGMVAFAWWEGEHEYEESHREGWYGRLPAIAHRVKIVTPAYWMPLPEPPVKP